MSSYEERELGAIWNSHGSYLLVDRSSNVRFRSEQWYQ